MILPRLLFPALVTAGGILTALVPTFARSAETLSSPVETIAPRDTAAYRREVRKAFAALRADSLSQAQRALEAALGHDPDAAGNDVLRFNIAKILMARRQWHDAEERLRDLLAHRPDYGEAQIALAQCLSEANKDSELAQWVDTLLADRRERTTDEVHTLLFLQSEACRRLHQDERALTALRRVLKTDRYNARAHSLIALQLYTEGHRDEALLHLGTALLRHPDVGAELAEREGDKVTALERLEHLLRLRPDDRPLQVHRATLLLDLGRRNEARRQLDSLRAAAGDELAEQLLPLYHRLR